MDATLVLSARQSWAGDVDELAAPRVKAAMRQ
jgi:hypothetical protein